MDMDMGHSATWSPARSSSGYPTIEGNSSGEMAMTHAVTYTSGDSPSKVVVRRTFIECVSEETEGLRTAAQRHRSEPAVPSFAGYGNLAEEESSNDSKERAEAIHGNPSYGDEKNDTEDRVEVFDGGVDCLGEEMMHREASEVGPLPCERDPQLVVKRTFLEVVERCLDGDREHRSMSMPVGGQVNEDPDAPSLTEQLLERMRRMQGRTGAEPAEGDLPMNSALCDPAQKATLGISKTIPEGVRFAPESESVDHSQSNRDGLEFNSTPSMGSETACGSECAPDDVEPDPSLGPRTTVMLRNLPSNFTRPLLLSLLDREGFYAFYDFVYLPIDFGSRSGFGYAFINLCDVETAERFRAHFQGFTAWETLCSKAADVTWSGTHQGLEQHVNRYRNSPVMHETMPDECKPIVLKKGVRTDFPPPTKPLRPPRIRPSKNRGARLAAERHS